MHVGRIHAWLFLDFLYFLAEPNSMFNNNYSRKKPEKATRTYTNL